MISSERAFLLSKDALYQQAGSRVNKFLKSVEHITNVPESDEIIYIMRDLRKRICRLSASGDKKQTYLLITVDCIEIMAIGHANTTYLTVVYTVYVMYGHEYQLCLVDDIDCLTKPVTSLQVNLVVKHVKISKASIGICFDHSIFMRMGPFMTLSSPFLVLLEIRLPSHFLRLIYARISTETL